MTTTTLNPAAAGILATGTERSFGTSQNGPRGALDKYRAYRTSVSALKALTDRQLKDVGISRSAIRQHAMAAVYGK